jgi:hypothetical protein
MILWPGDIAWIDAFARQSFREVEAALEGLEPPVKVDYGCSSGGVVAIFSFMRVRLPEPIVVGVTVSKSPPSDSLQIRADVVVDDTGYVLLEEPEKTLSDPTLASLLKVVGATAARLSQRVLADRDALGLQPAR